MKEKIIIAGFGGQGIIFMGRILADAGLLEEKEVTCLPSYGPEMRGGTANCMIVVSSHKIGSPYFTEPSGLIAMNLPSLDRFEPVTEPNGSILVNSSVASRSVMRTDLKSAYVQANEIAQELGDLRAANMVALGAFVGMKPVVQVESLITCVNKILSTRQHEMRSVNERALLLGFKKVSGGAKSETTSDSSQN